MDNNFDKYFKDKLENRKFEMKPEYWEGAEALIEAQEKTRSWRRLIWWFSGVLLLGIVAFSFWKKTDNTSTSISSNDKKDKVETSIIEPTENSNATKILNPTNSILENDNNEQKEILKSKSKSKLESNETTSKAASNSSTQNNFFQKNNISKNQNIQSRQHVGNTVTDKIGRENLDFPIIENALKNQNIKNDKPIITNEKNENDEVLKSEISPLIALGSLTTFLEEKEKNEIQDLEIKTCFEFPKPKKWKLALVAGMVGYPLIENTSTRPFIGAKGGVVLERNLTDKLGKYKWTIGSELLYHFRSGNFIVSQQNENVEYSFGRTLAKNELTPRSLHYVELPVYMKYHKSRASFEAGASANYLAGVYGELSQNGVTEKGWMTSEGFKNFHVNVLLGIHYRISDNLRFGVRANYTPNGILEKRDEGEKLLRESGPLYLTFRVTQYLN